MNGGLLDPKFKYTPAAATDIRKTFAKARREIEERKRPPAVTDIKQGRAKKAGAK